MKNNIVLIGKETNYFLIDFLEKKDILFTNYNENQNYEEGQVFFFSSKANEVVAKKEIEKINKINKEIYIILPHLLKKYFVNEIHKKIYYPFEIFTFDNFIKKILNKNFLFDDLLINGNYIENTNNKTRTYLTETQISILKILISGNKVKKEKIKKNILKITNSIETKSLESHLSRIRRKLVEIKCTTTIASVDTDHIKLITPRIDH